ncbi:MAG TPA: phage holin family protein [Acidimicrobiales bacterium]|nr:phage holin family protein [Acidimicrobiales bacterium]
MATRARQVSEARPVTEERSLGDLFSEMTQQLQVLMRKEIELARVETKEQVSLAAKTGATFGALAVVGLLAAVILAMAAAYGLAEVMPVGLAFLIVGVVLAVVAFILLQAGKKRAAALRPVPAQTIATVKGDVEEAKSAIQRGAQNDTWSDYGRSS